jgi:DNA-binding beta-propeller fold protein YncE
VRAAVGHECRTRTSGMRICLLVLFSLLLPAAAQATPLTLYAAHNFNNSTSHNVSQFAVGSDHTLSPLSPATLASPAFEQGIATTPDGLHVYVANDFSNSVSQYSASSSGALTSLSPSTVGAGTNPRGLAVSPDGKSLYAANAGAGSVGSISQYSIGSGGLLSPMAPASVGGCSNASQIAVSPDGTSVYATCAGGNTVEQYSVGNGGALTPTSSVATGSSPYGIGISPDGRYLYVANDASNTVSQYTVGTGGLLTPMSPSNIAAGTYPAGLVVSPDGRSVYVTNYNSGNVSQYDVGSGGSLSAKSPATVAAVGKPYGVALTPDGTSLYVADANGAAGGADIVQYAIGTNGNLSALSPATVASEQSPFALAIGWQRQSQTITFPATAVTYGQSDFSPATASSGLKVTYSNLSGQCTLDSSGMLKITGAGSCTATASQSGNLSYYAATPVTQTFTVNQAVVHVDAAQASKTQYDQDPAPAASLRASDFVNGDSQSTSGITGSASCTIGSHVEDPGTYPGVVTCASGSLSSPNYSLVSGNSASLTIVAAPPQDLAISSSGVASRTGSTVDPHITLTCSSGHLACTASEKVSVVIGAPDTPIEGVQNSPHSVIVGSADSTIPAGGSVQATFTLSQFGLALLTDHRQLHLHIAVSGQVQSGPTVSLNPNTLITGTPAHYSISRVRALPDGTVRLQVRVSAPGRIRVLVSAWKDNIAGVARVLKPAPGRFVVARATADPTRAGLLTLRVPPSRAARRLIGRPAHRATLRVWVSYIPLYSFQVDTGFYAVHPGSNCSRCRVRVWP